MSGWILHEDLTLYTTFDESSSLSFFNGGSWIGVEGAIYIVSYL
jgi:hypothetical protein